MFLAPKLYNWHRLETSRDNTSFDLISPNLEINTFLNLARTFTNSAILSLAIHEACGTSISPLHLNEEVYVVNHCVATYQKHRMSTTPNSQNCLHALNALLVT